MRCPAGLASVSVSPVWAWWSSWLVCPATAAIPILRGPGVVVYRLDDDLPRPLHVSRPEFRSLFTATRAFHDGLEHSQQRNIGILALAALNKPLNIREQIGLALQAA